MKILNIFLIASAIVCSLGSTVYCSALSASDLDAVDTQGAQDILLIDEDQLESDFVKYDDLHRLRAVESMSLQQPTGDVIDSVAFNFEDIDLQNVAEYMERVHKVKFITDDILDPSKSTQKLAGNKVSFRTNAPLSKQESWSLFITFLSMAGLDVVPMADAGFYKIVPLPGASQESIPAYIGASPSLLPDNDMVVRYVYFIQNADPLKIQSLISKFQGATGSLTVYKDLKALIFTDKSYNIKSLMTIVKELDKSVTPQAMSVVKLKRANVEDVINLYNSLKPTQTSQRAWSPENKDPATDFFSQSIVLSGDRRTNTLVILGPKDAITRLEDFIAKHIDIEIDNAKTPVFVYYLEYTNASDMQKTIKDLVQYGSQTTAGQYGGVRDGQKYLQPMTIVADTHSNALIINTTPEDYVAVEELIKQLDVPQKQIALEVLIVQVSGTKTKILGSQISGPNSNNTFLKSVSAQTSGIPPVTPIVTTSSEYGQNDIAHSIKSGLNRLLIGTVGQAGATVLTFGQPIWAIFKVLKTITTTKILQNPFMVVSNNSKGVVRVGTTRRVVTGEAVTGGARTATGYQQADAFLTVEIIPQINDNQMINLGISIDNEQFVNLDAVNDAVKDSKSIATAASVADGEVLVLGGIMADKTSGTTHGVPLLSKIPVFGWMFKSKSAVVEKNMFMVFICPKIMDNISSQVAVQEYTRNKIEETQDYLRLMEEAESINAKQDPIDRAFFGANENKSDDLTTNRLLHRGELVSRHETVLRERVVTTPKDVTKNKNSSRSTKTTKKKKSHIDTIDMSEKRNVEVGRSMNSIKNIVESTSGVTL